jgi:hypothetical protein
VRGQRPILELGGGWPGWVPRVVVLLAGAGAVGVAAVAAGGLNTGVLVALAVLVGLSAAMPNTPGPAVLIAAVVVLLTLQDGDPLRWSVLVEIPLLHLVHVGAALSAIVPVRALIVPVALLAPARRFLLVQLGVFAVAGFAALLPADRNPAIVEVVGLLAVTGISLLAIRLLHARR